MKKIVIFLAGLLALAACQSKPAAAPDYVVQVSLGPWNAPAYTAEQINARIDSVSALIPVGKVIIGWSLDKDIY
ncbi:MAG: hypothetical protein IKX83_05110, partial [Clostridia bacterium]|nr:hypothetical protein [Clostridia bacterium]